MEKEERVMCGYKAQKVGIMTAVMLVITLITTLASNSITATSGTLLNVFVWIIALLSIITTVVFLVVTIAYAFQYFSDVDLKKVAEKINDADVWD